MEIVLECPICFHPYSDPRMLGCGHSFCLDCLSKSAKANPTPCPVCAQADKIPTSKDVPSLPRNFALGAALDVQRKRVKCPECLEPVLRQRLFYCRQDEFIGCGNCMLVCYISLFFKTHVTKPPPPIRNISHPSIFAVSSPNLGAARGSPSRTIEGLAGYANEASGRITEMAQISSVLPVLFKAALEAQVESLVRDETSTTIPNALDDRLIAIDIFANNVSDKLSQLTQTIFSTLDECSKDVRSLLQNYLPRESAALIKFAGRDPALGPDLSETESNLIVQGTAVSAVSKRYSHLFSRYPKWPWDKIYPVLGISDSDDQHCLIFTNQQKKYGKHYPATANHLGLYTEDKATFPRLFCVESARTVD